jgi:hypothetical protein
MFVLDHKQCLFIQQYNDVLVNITTTNTLFVFAIVWTDNAPSLRVQFSFHDTKTYVTDLKLLKVDPLAVTHGATR